MIPALLTSLLLSVPPYDCPAIIKQDLEVRHRHCVKSMRPFEDENWLEHLAGCDRRVRRSARVWGCPVPREWGEPVKWMPPKPKEDE